jgi:osmotically-inducible protein OsmY
MKNALVAMVCTLGAVACGGNNRPAEEPTTTTTTTTTETTTANANGVRRSTASTPSTSAPSAGTSASATGATRTTDGLDMTRPTHTEATTGTAATNASAPAPASAPTVGATATDNPGVANGTKDATNTKINDRDRHGALTPMDQGGGNDRDITAAVRRAVVGDKALSFTAKNVKIITVGGKVTLRGPVKSDDEKSSIEAKAKATTGVASVDNQLEVKK